MRVAAETFEIRPSAQSQARTLVNARPARVFSAIKNSVILIDDRDTLRVLLTSHFITHNYRVSNFFRDGVGKALGIPREAVICFSSHNHCVVKLIHPGPVWGRSDEDLVLPESDLTPEGQELLHKYIETASRLRHELKEVTVRHGRGRERRITHNRKGRRADGSTFLMREEDRLQWGADYTGDIDDDAFVVGFFDHKEQPVAMLTHFTGHPVTAFHCDFPIVHGEFPQVACDDLSAAFGAVPVAFLQGCAGDINAKGLLAVTPAEENVRKAEHFGHQLGETFVSIAQNLQPSRRNDAHLVWRRVSLPFVGVPSRADLAKRLAGADEFLERCESGNVTDTRRCDGLNFPTNMSTATRTELIKPVRNWLSWALALHDENRLHDAPIGVSLHLAALRIGDIGIVGLPCEPLLGIGRQIKRRSPLDVTLPCGYMNDTSPGYIPDGPNCEDRDYVSAFYRYTTTMLPFAHPAGDLLASAAIKMLEATLTR
jgi:hypothetical protein